VNDVIIDCLFDLLGPFVRWWPDELLYVLERYDFL